MQIGYHIDGVPLYVSSRMIDVPRGAETTLGGYNGVVHRTTLIGVAGRVSLEWVIGFFGVMAYQQITVGCYRAYSFLLGVFAMGTGSWDFKGFQPILWIL